jgi:PAS domain S-box-containing protein
VIASVGNEAALHSEGASLDQSLTYCRRTVEATSPIAVSNATKQGWSNDPAYEEHGVECYLGTTIFVDGDVFGTVCFISDSPRQTSFTSDEKVFVELVARLLGRAIEASEVQFPLEQRETEQDSISRRYTSLLHLAPDAIFLADADTGAIVEANEKTTELSGYEPDELRKLSIYDLHPVEHRDRYEELFQQVGEERQRSQFDDGTQLFLRQADGSMIPIELSLRQVSIDNTTLVHGIIRDISVRKEREHRLERNKEFLQRTQEAADIGGWEVDCRSDTLQWTDEVYRIHGLPLEYEVTVTESLGFYHPEDQPLIRDAFDHLTSEGESYDLEVRIVRPDDSIRWVNTVGHPVYDEDEQEVIKARGIFRDITERKDRERDLRIQSQAIEEAPIGISIGDATQPNTPLTYVNNGFSALTGYTKSEAVGQKCDFLQGEGTDDDTRATIKKAVESEEALRTEILNYRKNGTPFWNRLTLTPVTGAKGSEVTHYVGIQEDITARKRRDRLIEVFDRVLRHNLRNAMAVIQMNCHGIIDQTEGKPERLARKVLDKTAELSDLSEKVRNFDKLVGQPDRLEHRDVEADIRDIVTDLRREYPDAEFQIVAGECEPVRATPQLRLALRELGENAVIHCEEPSVTFIARMTEDERVEIQVSDDGDGLPESEQAVLESGSESPLKHGSGLGLWLVNWVVTGLGGEVLTEVDGGTTMRIRLPSTEGDSYDRDDIHWDATLDGHLK